MKKKDFVARKWFLVALYVVTLVICLILNINQNTGIYDQVINIGFFLVVGVIFVFAYKKFGLVEKVTEDLKQACQSINYSYNNSDNKDLLLEKYKDGSMLFKTNLLSKEFNNYLNEISRLKEVSNDNYKCDISEYINYELIDEIMSKNQINLIPGTMTGLGILGTFIGLSIGLQGFNTGSADQIANSIPGLMEGIKVAFHTSIYGMILSLVFNFIFKNTCESAYNAIDEFYESYYKYVSPDATSENASAALIIQNSQVEVVRAFEKSLGNIFFPYLKNISDVSTQMLELQLKQKENMEKSLFDMNTSLAKGFSNMNASFEQGFSALNNNFEIFATKVGESQTESLMKLVDKFVDTMNQALGDNFERLGKVIFDTSELQRQNNEYMQDVLQKVGNMTLNIKEINEMSERTVTGFSNYINDIESLQEIINKNFVSVNLQLEENNNMSEKMKAYIDELVAYEKNITDISAQFADDMAAQAKALGEIGEDISNTTKTNLDLLAHNAEMYVSRLGMAAEQQIGSIIALSSDLSTDITNAAKELSDASGDLSADLNQAFTNTFRAFDSELATITKHLSGTIANVDETTGRVPQVVAAAYDGMRKSFDDMQKNMKSMVEELELLQRELPVIDKNEEVAEM